MSLSAEVTLTWGDGTYTFALKAKQIEELQNVCGKVGLGAIYQRVMLGVWLFGDLRHTIRLGLIGGGVGPVRALELVNTYVGSDEKIVPLVAGEDSPENVAKSILGAVMHGFEDKERPKGEAGAGATPASSISPITEPYSSETTSTQEPSTQ